MVDSIISSKIKFDNESRTSRGGHLDKLVSVSAEVFSSSGPELGVATGHSSPLHPHPGHDVPLQHLDQLSLVPHQLVQTVHWNLVKSSVSWSEDSEWSRSSESLHHASSLESSVEGGEVLILSNQSSDTLAGAGLDCGLLLLMMNLLDWTTGENIGVRSPDTVVRSMVRLRWSVREVVVKSSDRSGNIGKSLLLLSQVEWIERLGQSWSHNSWSVSHLRSASKSNWTRSWRKRFAMVLRSYMMRGSMVRSSMVWGSMLSMMRSGMFSRLRSCLDNRFGRSRSLLLRSSMSSMMRFMFLWCGSMMVSMVFSMVLSMVFSMMFTMVFSMVSMVTNTIAQSCHR